MSYSKNYTEVLFAHGTALVRAVVDPDGPRDAISDTSGMANALC